MGALPQKRRVNAYMVPLLKGKPAAQDEAMGVAEPITAQAIR